MALPQKNIKLDLDIQQTIKTGEEYMRLGLDRIEQLMIQTNLKTNYFPRSIHMQDLDQAMYDFVNNDKINLKIDGEKTPVIYMENERWGEFSKTWQLTDSDKNVSAPYIIVRRTSKAVGTRIGTKTRVAQGRLFNYLEIPILDEGEIIYLIFKIPEPVNVDLTYDITLFTKYREDVNTLDEIIFKTFSSIQEYTWIKGFPVPIILESTNESNTIENFDGEKIYVVKYTLKMQGLLIDENDFEISRTSRKPKFSYKLLK